MLRFNKRSRSRATALTIAILALVTQVRGASVALDTNFNPPNFTYPDFASRVLLLPDGKFLEYFNVQTLADVPTAGAINRFLSDGTLDNSFSFSRNYDSVVAAAPLGNGQVVVAAEQPIYGSATWHILRLNTDGSVDNTFNAPTTPSTLNGEIRTIAIQPDGKILVAGFFQNFSGYQGIIRLNSDGSIDSTFVGVTLQFDNTSFSGGTGANGLWARPVVQSNGKILIAGDFVGVNGIVRPGIARLNSNGTLDSTFIPSGVTRTGTHPIRSVVVQSNGQIVLGGKFSVPASFTANHTGLQYNKLPNLRLNSNGVVDQAYGCFADLTVNGNGFTQARDAVIQPDDKVVMIDISLYRFNTDGSLDPTFRQPVLLIQQGVVPTSFPEAFTLNLQSDGKVLFAGDFTDIDDATGPPNGLRFGVGRVNSDGTLDTSFLMTHKTGYNTVPTSFARFSEATATFPLIAFNTVSASLIPPELAIPHNFGRLQPDGSVDTSFDPLSDESVLIYATGFATLSDGSVVVQGPKDPSGTGAVRITPDGSLDVNFGHNGKSPYDPDVSTGHLGSDGKILLLAPALEAVASGNLLERFLPDATYDNFYHIDPQVTAAMVERSGSGQSITTISNIAKLLAIYPDGRCLLGFLATDSTWRLVRLTTNGTIDASFQAGSVPAINVNTSNPLFTDPVTGQSGQPNELSQLPVNYGFADAQILSNGQIIVVGNFASYGSSSSKGIVRLNSDGTVDTTFQSGAGAQWTQTAETGTFRPSIDNVELENDGKLLVTGTFEAFNGVAASGIASLNPNGSVDNSFSVALTRNKFDYSAALLARQPDGSFFLSGPYTSPSQPISPSFFHLNSFGGIPIIGSPAVANATVGQSFSYVIVASGQPTSYSISGLPPGFSDSGPFGSVDVITGSGLAQSVGSYLVSLTASNAEGTSTTSFLQFNVQAVPAPPTPPANDNFANAQAISGIGGTLQAANINGTAPATKESGEPNHAGNSGGASVWYKWTAPLTRTFFFNTHGSNLNTLLAVYTGNSVNGLSEVASNDDDPTAGDGSSSLQFTAVQGTVYYIAVDGAGGATGNFQLNWGIPPSTATNPIITSPLEANGAVGKQFVYQIVANNAPTSYSATNLPPGLTINSFNGVISGIPSQAGITSATISAVGSSTGSATLQITIDPAPSVGPVITSASSATGRTGRFFSFQVLASGLTAAARASASGLPDGLTIDDVSGLISGTPTTNGSFEVFVAIVDGSNTALQTLQLTFTSDTDVPIITSPSTAQLITGQSFSYTIVAPTTAGPNDPTIFSLIGTLPAGLTFDAATGTISGTPRITAERNPYLIPMFRRLSDTPIVGNVQLVASNSQGTATTPLNFVQPEPNPLLNISTRLAVQTGDNVLIGGFVISGMEPKKVILRAIGATLAQFGLSNVLANPTIEIHDHTGAIIMTNDNWADSQKADVLATGLEPPNDFESAAVMTLNPGAYTAIVHGYGNATGIGLVEVYDISQASSSNAVNISTRGFVEAGDNVMIAGFVVSPSGTGTANVLIRGLGPTLASFGLANCLPDPVLEIHNSDGSVLAINDNWKDSQQAAINATGLAPPNDLEAGVILSLPPGAYTAILKDRTGQSGVGLVEVYALH